MTPSARQSRLHLRIGGSPFPVLALRGTETLNRPFAFTVSVMTDWRAVAGRLGDPAVLTLTAPDGFERRVRGVLTKIEVEKDLEDGQSVIDLTVESSLALLRQRTDSRLIVSRTLPEILRETLGRNGIAKSALRFHLTRDYPVRPITLQARESDLDFVLRLAGREGLLIWSDVEDAGEIIHIADAPTFCPTLSRQVLPWLPQAGLETTSQGGPRVGMLSIEDRAKQVPARHLVHDVNENAPENPLLAERSIRSPQAGAAARSVSFASGAATHEEAEHQALIRAQRAEGIRHTVKIRTHAADLRPGALIRLDTTGFSTYLSGDYLIIRIDHEARQYAGLGFGGEKDRPYSNTAVLISRETPWRPRAKPTEELPMIFPARIESRAPLTELDPAGRCRYRQYPDSENKVSPPVRRLQPYLSPAEGLPAGWHLPLHGENEVLVSCLNGDPDRPMLAGTLSNPANRSVVTAENAHQNRLLTFGGNAICMDDLRDKSAITLCTFAGHTMLHLNADVLGHRVRLAAEKGGMQTFARKTMTTKCGDSLTETVGGDRIQQVENRHRTATKTKEVHHQAKTDGNIAAGQNIHLQSGKNIELTAGRDMHLDITEASRIHVEQRDAVIQMDSGSLNITADGAIDIQGDGHGTITFAQSGGGFKMAPNGDITLFGDNVSLKADAINFYGQVNQEITEPPPAPVAEAPKALKVQAIQDLDPVVDNTSDSDSLR